MNMKVVQRPWFSSGMIFFLLIFWLSDRCAAKPAGWCRLDEGLYVGLFDPPIPSKIYNTKIIVLKIDPRHHALKLLSASERGREARSVRQWCQEFDLLAAINASMYQSADPMKSTGFMKNYSHYNNSRINEHFGAFLLFNPVDSAQPEVKILDRRREKHWEEVIKKYHSAVQNYRIISRGEKTGWPQREILHSSAAVGVDTSDRVFFIHSPSPHSIHDFIRMLLMLPLHIVDAMYVEGGAEAELYIPFRKKSNMSCRDSISNTHVASSIKIPNVIGITKR